MVAGKLAIFTERDDVEPVAISVEVIFGEIFVPFNFISRAEFFGFGPGFRLDADEFNVTSVGVFLEKIVAELMKQLKGGAVGGIGNGGWGRKTETITSGDGEIRVIFAEFICQRV